MKRSAFHLRLRISVSHETGLSDCISCNIGIAPCFGFRCGREQIDPRGLEPRRSICPLLSYLVDIFEKRFRLARRLKTVERQEDWYSDSRTHLGRGDIHA